MRMLLLVMGPSADPTGRAGASATVAIDPTLLALLSIFGGALLTAAAAAWGAWRQSKREHMRWLRERRYESYVDQIRTLRTVEAALANSNRVNDSHLRLSARAQELMQKLDEAKSSDDEIEAIETEADRIGAEKARLTRQSKMIEKRLSGLVEEIEHRIAPFYLLGPAHVRDAARVAARALRDPAVDQEIAFRDLEAAMRRAIGVEDFDGR